MIPNTLSRQCSSSWKIRFDKTLLKLLLKCVGDFDVFFSAAEQKLLIIWSWKHYQMNWKIFNPFMQPLQTRLKSLRTAKKSTEFFMNPTILHLYHSRHLNNSKSVLIYVLNLCRNSVVGTYLSPSSTWSRETCNWIKQHQQQQQQRHVWILSLLAHAISSSLPP